MVHFLPSANEVWGKVIFSEACVKNSVHGRGWAGLGGVCSRGDAWSGGCLVQGGAWSRGVPGPGGGGCLVETPRTATAAGGTHSCFQNAAVFLNQLTGDYSHIVWTISFDTHTTHSMWYRKHGHAQKKCRCLNEPWRPVHTVRWATAFFYRMEWVVWMLMILFTWCDCDTSLCAMYDIAFE